MFSSIIESVLVKFLGKYVDGIKNNMDFNLITGNATIEKISLRPEFINQLGLPFMLKYSHVSKILINVPWANLKQKPTTVTVQGIYVLLSLKYDDMEQMYIDPEKKIKTIINRVKQEIKKKWEQKESNKPQTFAQKSIIRIIDNLVVSIDEIHVRVESIKRNWDFSFGVIIDKISSFTVNEYGQKTFYTRHFTNKELNQPLKKSFICQRFDIYFNDKQQFFMCEKQDKNKNQTIKTLLMEPFQTKLLQSSPKKKQSLTKSQNFELKQSYKMKILSKFSFDIIAEQKLSPDKKYIVQVKGQLPRICFNLTDIQLSQILVVCQLIYEWVIDKQKNGRKNIVFDVNTQTQFKKMLHKLIKQQKLSTQQYEVLFEILRETSTTKLQNSADNFIKQYRIEKQMKKINKASNKQKSKEMIQKLLQRIENQNQQVLQLFEHIMIQISLPEFKLCCVKDEKTLLQIGLNSIMTNVKLVLAKHTFISVSISQPFIKEMNGDQVKDLIMPTDQKYMKQPFSQFQISLLNKSPPKIKTTLKKRYIKLDDITLHNLISWIGCIKLKPPLVNFLDQQLNYSIYITQQIFKALFDHELSLDISLQIPVLAIQLNSLLEIDWGTMLINRQSQKQYCIRIDEKQRISIDGNLIMEFKEGNCVNLLNIVPQTVKVELCSLRLEGIGRMFRFLGEFLRHPIVKEIKKLQPIAQQQIIFQGKFMLNEYITPQNMLLRGNYLKFFPSGQSVYLLRSKMYPFIRKNQFGLIFRQQVQKTINMIMMDSQKLMYTLFQTIKQHMLYICTISQWKKYYQKFPCILITEVSQIQTQEENNSLIDLHICLNNAEIDIGDTKLGRTLLSVNQFMGVINYKEYNTDAKGDIGCFGLSLGKEKLIENLAIAVEYSYKDWMGILINVLMFKLNVDTYEVIEQIVGISAQYSVIVNNFIQTLNSALGKKQQNYLLEKVSSQQDISYLLQSKISIRLSNIQTLIIGFRNMLKSSQIQISKYRNNPIPYIRLRMRQIVLMSCVTLGSCQLTASNAKVDLQLNNLAIYLSFQLLFYELTTGRGHKFLNSILAATEAMGAKGGQSGRQRVLPDLNVKLRGFKARFRLIQGQQISLHARTILATAYPQQHQQTTSKIQCKNLSILINNNIVLQPLCYQMCLTLDKQFAPKKITINMQQILINISIHKLLQSILVIKLSIQRLLSLQIIRSLLTSSIKANNPRLVENSVQPGIDIFIGNVKVILYNSQDWQLLRLKINAISFNNEKNKNNQIQLLLEHLNYGFRIYEPVVEDCRMNVCIKDGPQAHISFSQIRANISEQLIRDILKQLILTKQAIRHALKNTKFHVQELTSASTQIQKYKNIIISMILPQQLQPNQSGPEQQQQNNKVNSHSHSNSNSNSNSNVNSHSNNSNSNVNANKSGSLQIKKQSQEKTIMSVLQVRNHLKTQVLVQVKIDQKKTQLHLKLENDQGQVTFKVRPQYKQSYQMVEKYKQILVKLSLIHPTFYTQSLYFQIFLHKRAYTYHPCTFNNDNGQQLPSCIGLYIHQQQNSINYIMDIISPFRIINTTSVILNLNWIKGQDHYYRQLNQNDQQWVSPWVNDKVTINPKSDHLFASSFQVLFQRAHGLYEIGLSNMIGSQVYNYCCLTVERRLFQLGTMLSREHNNKKQNQISPATMVIKPTYYIINHLHSPISINQIQCEHKQKVPLYSLFRTKKSQMFLKLKLGDGSMHEIYLPKDGQTNTVQLALKKQNYVTISILRQRSLQGTGISSQNQCVYHIYAKLELLISLPKMEDLTLVTNILSTRYVLRKQVDLGQSGGFENVHPSVMEGTNLVLRDRFCFYTYVHVLDEFQRYLEIKSQNCYCKEVTLYPSYYGNDLPFYSLPKQAQPNSQPDKLQQIPPTQKPVRKYCINYEHAKITSQISMFYVNILPKYYILNLSSQVFNIDGQPMVKYNERIVVDSDQVEIVLNDSHSRWNMLHNSISINLAVKKQVLFFRQVFFREHEINQQLKSRTRRKSSQQLKPNELHTAHSSPHKQIKKKITISTQNIRIFDITKHIGTCSVTTFCINEWDQWVKIHNNLDKTIVCLNTYIYVDLEIKIQTVIRPGEVGSHPYGVDGLPTLEFFLLGDQDQVICLGEYQNHLRFNDQIQLTAPQKQPQEPPKLQTIVMYEVKAPKGRKVIFAFSSSSEQTYQQNKKIRSLIIPAFLRISQSLKVTISNVFASIIVGANHNRKQLIRLSSKNIDFLLLAYPSGLYMIQFMMGLELQAPQFPELVLSIPNVQFYLEAVQMKFIQRVTLKIPKQMTVFLTDKLIYEIIDVALRNLDYLKKISPSISDSISLSQNSPKKQSQAFYTSSLNSVLISQIKARVTVKKMIIQNRQNQKKLIDMGVSIVELQGSLIKLSKIDIDEPLNRKHIDKIMKTYIMEIVMGCLGGMNLIGNPKQFMEEIEAGNSRGKPVVGFVGGVLAGTANSLGKIFSTVSNSVSQLSMDYDYQRQRNQSYMHQPKGFANGVKQGSKSLITSVKSGLVGLYTKPKQGLIQEGGIGLLKGTFEGLAGAIVKSVTGVIDAASMTVRGIKSASSYSSNPLDQTRYLQKPLYHKFKIIRPYDKIDEIVYNSLVRIFRQKGVDQQSIDIVQGCILQDEHNKQTQQAVIVTSQKLYVINYEEDTIDNQIPNNKMNATGKFLQGVVLYFNEMNQKNMSQDEQYDHRDNGEEIVFRISSNPIKKQRLYSTLKAFVDLYAQSKDKEEIPQ